jgi:hypothetical protein
LFTAQNLGKGTKRTVAALAVAARGLVQDLIGSNPPKQKFNALEFNMTKTGNLRGSQKPVAKKQQKMNTTTKPAGLTKSQVMAPVSVGTSIRAIKPVMSRNVEGGHIRGKDFLGTVEGFGVATFGLGKSALLNPAYFFSTFLGNFARSYEKYRWNSLRIHYVPKVATSAIGQLVMCSQRSVTEPGLRPEAGTFLNRAMSQGNAAFSPLWTGSYIDIDTDGEFRLVDPTSSADLDDAIHEELQVYCQTSVSGQVGYLIAEYDISFKEPIFQPHSTSIPISTGPGMRVVLTDAAGINSNLDDWNLVDSFGLLGLGTIPNGTIYRGVFDLQGSSPPTGGTFANSFAINLETKATTSTVTRTPVPLPLVGGTTLYFLVEATNLKVYSSLEGAIANTDQIFFRLATTEIGAYGFDMALVRQGKLNLTQIQ